MERPQPVHWPQEVSNCLSLPPGNSTGQSWEAQQLTSIEGAFPLMNPPPSEEQACILLPEKQKRWAEDRWTCKQHLSHLTPALLLGPHLFLVYSFTIHYKILGKGPSVSPQC